MTLERQIKDAKKNVKLVSSLAIGETLLDLGANIGEVTINCAHLFDRVIAVEANPATCLVLSERVKEAGLNDKVTVINAVVAEVGDMTYFVSTPSDCSIGSTARPTARMNKVDYYKEVKTVAFDDLARGATLIKMDIESSEYECLRNAIIPDCVQTIVVEFHETNRRIAEVRSIVHMFYAQGLRLTNPEVMEASPTWSLKTLIFRRL